MGTIRVEPRDIDAASKVVEQVAIRTPLRRFDSATSDDVFLKLENLQRLGAFKIRGAWNRISKLSPAERARGIATISSGNHGLAVAWSAKRLGLRCVVYVPEDAPTPKVEAIRAQGAELRTLPRKEHARAHVDEIWKSWPEAFIHPFAHPLTIAGQGTVGREIVEDAPAVRTVLVPVGGGGLISGIAIALKARVPGAKVVSVQAEGAAPLPTVFRTRSAFRVEWPQTIADGIRIGLILPEMADLLLRHVDGCLVVSDDEIRRAMRRLALEAHVVAEPAGAAAFAAWERYGSSLEGPIAIVVSGGNVEPRLLRDVLA
jgi:threonine dehydratase